MSSFEGCEGRVCAKPSFSCSAVDLKRLLPARAAAPRKRKSSESYPRKVRMDIFLVGHNSTEAFPIEPNKNKNKTKQKNLPPWFGDDHLLYISSYHLPTMLMSLCPNFPCSIGKEFACNAGDPCSIPGLGRSAREGIGYQLHYSWASLVAQLVKNLLAI